MHPYRTQPQKSKQNVILAISALMLASNAYASEQCGNPQEESFVSQCTQSVTQAAKKDESQFNCGNFYSCMENWGFGPFGGETSVSCNQPDEDTLDVSYQGPDCKEVNDTERYTGGGGGSTPPGSTSGGGGGSNNSSSGPGGGVSQTTIGGSMYYVLPRGGLLYPNPTLQFYNSHCKPTPKYPHPNCIIK